MIWKEVKKMISLNEKRKVASLTQVMGLAESNILLQNTQNNDIKLSE